MQHSISNTMRRGTSLLAAIALPALLISSHSAFAAEKKSEPKSGEQAIRDGAKAYVGAFEKGDAKAIAELWAPDGTMTDESGELLSGRSAIEAAYAKYFKANPGTKIQVAVTSIEFPSEGVAIEDGVSTSVAANGRAVSTGRYTAVHALKGGKWQMTSVRESAAATAPHEIPMADVQSLVGTWEAKQGKTVVRSEFHPTAGGKFLQRDYSVATDGVAKSSGFQLIGFDPVAGCIRSWTFDSTGAHGTGFWTPTPDGWAIDSVGCLPDGTPTASLDFVIRIPGNNTVLGYRSVNRRAGGARLPDLPEVVLDRVAVKK
ncbi:MAG: SgcJ/EcaC family oxidoreductase [Candidatus Sumerlaeaceae bacterium]|nr:SgcJ/EcaC family oxidoreductase [Candidatus Sumerlaeaceae bacterium]